jgi:transposase
VARVETFPYKALKTFIGILRNWWQPILNYFVGRYNNDFAEGVNLKIKMLNRRGFGYRNFKSFRLHVLIAFCPL